MKIKKEYKIIAFVLVILVLIGVGIGIRFANNDSIIDYENSEKYTIKNGEYVGDPSRIQFSIDKSGKYEFTIEVNCDECPGFVTAVILKDADNNVVFWDTGAYFTVSGRQLELNEGLYTVDFEIIPGEKELNEFINALDSSAEVIPFEEARDGEWEVQRIYRVEGKYINVKLFMLLGFLTGLALAGSLRTLIYDIGGGIIDDRPFKAVQTGGPSGGCIPEDLLDLPVDFDTLTEHGAMMGSGGMIVMDDRSCMVEVARYYVDFLCEESCGKCTPCREGLRQMRDILTRICEGKGKKGDIEMLERIAYTMKDASLCALGKSAANPVLTTIKYFRKEYEAHIKGHKCPAGVCANLTTFKIDPKKCKACMACTKACPTEAISGKPKSPQKINTKKCISCGSCRDVCKFDAVKTGGK